MRSLTAHLWSLDVEGCPDGVTERLFGFLQADERARMAAFMVPAPKVLFGHARGLLRWVLSRHWGGPETAWRFTPDANGKPQVEGRPEVLFNVSHTDGLALVGVLEGFAQDAWIGADVERVRDMYWRGVMGRFFGAPEQRWILDGPGDSGRFFALWTMKEAVLKAGGWGVSALERVSCVPPEDPTKGEACLRFAQEISDNARHWRLRYVPLGPEHPAAVAVSARVPFSLCYVCHDARAALASEEEPLAADHLK